MKAILALCKTEADVPKYCPDLAGIATSDVQDLLRRDYADWFSPRPSPVFCMAYRSTDTPYTWWSVVLEKQKDSVLAVCVQLLFHMITSTDVSLQILCKKIFSVSPNSMPDERTASQVTLLNSANRNGLELRTVESMIKIKQFHRKVLKVRLFACSCASDTSNS